MEEPLEIENWKRIAILGSGAFGVVSLWHHKISDDYIAVKKCKFKTCGHLSERQRHRWENEVQIMKNLNCANIVSYKPLPQHLESVLHKFNPTRLPLLSMEYCKKGNLRRVLNQVKNSTGLDESDVRVVLSDITKAVAYLHQQKITHRDIKPENIVLQDSNTRPGVIYKLIDLGYAKELNDSVVSFVGTLHYLAPEIMKTENYDESVDYWSLGIVAFEVICGVLPFLPQFTPVESSMRKRSKNYTETEIEILVKEVANRKNVLFGPLRGPNVTQFHRDWAWKKVASAVNAVAPVPRKVEELKKKFKDFKNKTKLKLIRGEARKTGGNNERTLKKIEEKMLEFIGTKSIQSAQGGNDTYRKEVTSPISNPGTSEAVEDFSEFIPPPLEFQDRLNTIQEHVPEYNALEELQHTNILENIAGSLSRLENSFQNFSENIVGSLNRLENTFSNYCSAMLEFKPQEIDILEEPVVKQEM